MIIEAYKLRIRKCLGHQNSGCAVSTSNIRHTDSLLEFRFHAIQRWNPGAHQIAYVVWTEESLCAQEERGIVFIPAHAIAGAKRLTQLWLVLYHGADYVECAGEICGASLVRQHEGLLGWQRELLA